MQSAWFTWIFERHVNHQRTSSPPLSLCFTTSQLGDATDGKLVFVSVCTGLSCNILLWKKYKQFVCKETSAMIQTIFYKPRFQLKYHSLRQKSPLSVSSELIMEEEKENPSIRKARIRPDCTVNRLVSSLCLSRGTWGLNTACFICWTTWELEAGDITMRMPSVSRELTKPPHPPSPGPLHWWTLTRKLKECLPLSDPKGSPATTAAASPPSTKPPPSCGCSHLSIPPSLSLFENSLSGPPAPPSLSGPKRTLLPTTAVSHSTLWQTTESPTVCLHWACVKRYGLS